MTARAWIAAGGQPQALIMLTGGDLDGARVDADLSFPALLKQDLSKWHAGFPPSRSTTAPFKSLRERRWGNSREAIF